MKIVYHGGGYVGLTGAVHFGRADVDVLVYDPDESVVDGINSGHPKSGEFLGYLAGDFPRDRVRATTDHAFACIASDIHIFAVPTERAGRPFDELVIESVKNVQRASKNPTLIIESTLTPGTVDRYLLNQLEGKPGEDYFLAVCPRRDWFADPAKNLENLPRVVGGVTPRCTVRTAEILSKVSRTILQTDYRTAEVVKAFENCLLHVPVMLAHQLACAMPNHDIAQALRLVTTHWRFQSMNPMYLNFGTGGRCVPLGTRYLSETAGIEFTIGREAIGFDEEMRQIVAEAVRAHRPPPANVCVMGLAYRPNFRDAGLSPGLDVYWTLRNTGYFLTACDPMWTDDELRGLFGVKPGLPTDADILVLATPHREFMSYEPRADQLVFDGQGAWSERKLACKYVQVGKPGWRG